MFSKAAELRSDEDLDVLQGIVEETGQNFEDPAAFATLDYKFHHEVGRFAGNLFLSTMQEMLHTHIYDFIMNNVRERSTRKKAYEDHQKLFECIKNKYTQQIVAVVEEHILTCRKHYESRFGKPKQKS